MSGQGIAMPKGYCPSLLSIGWYHNVKLCLAAPT
jgi:hypothetical protein